MLMPEGACRVGAEAEGRLLLQFLQVATLTREAGMLRLPVVPGSVLGSLRQRWRLRYKPGSQRCRCRCRCPRRGWGGLRMRLWRARAREVELAIPRGVGTCIRVRS